MEHLQSCCHKRLNLQANHSCNVTWPQFNRREVELGRGADRELACNDQGAELICCRQAAVDNLAAMSLHQTLL